MYVFVQAYTFGGQQVIRPIVFTEGLTEHVLDGQDWLQAVRTLSLKPRQRDAILKSFKFDIKL